MKYDYSDMIRLVKCTYVRSSLFIQNLLGMICATQMSGKNDSTQKISLMRPLIKKYPRKKTFLYAIFFLNIVIIFSLKHLLH